MIVPSIDLAGGRAVQLRQGRELLLVDPRDPVELARELARFGPLAVVDLDAALGRGENRALVRRICTVARCRVGGGIRSEEDVRGWIRAGAEQVMIGTRAKPDFLGRFPREWLVACLDARGRAVVDRGWTHEAGEDVLERARALEPLCGGFLFTQVEREGMLAGPDLETAARLRQAVGLPVTVAGGIRSAEDVRALEELGCHAQVGRALYEGSLDPVEVWLASVRFDERGLAPTLVVDAEGRRVLMLAWSSAASLARALRTGQGWYHSRSRGELWRKGATSGHVQELVEARWDCDRDALLFRVRQTGPACHRGTPGCFDEPPAGALAELERVLARRRASGGAASYTRRLLEDPALLAAKLREETGEVIEAAGREHVAWECADLVYHLLVRMQAAGVTWSEVERELRARARPEGA